MMDKKPHIKPYLYGMLAGFGAIALSILFFFLIYRFQGFGNAISKVTGILMPFIYGAVIAYLLKPVCNTVENFLRRLLPEKMGSTANMLAVAFSLLFGILVVYALFMMIVPQLVTSVTTLYYTARNNIRDFVDWASKQEIIRRYYSAACALRQGLGTVEEVRKIELIMNSAGISIEDRPVVKAALDRAEETGAPAVALELNDGTIITGKTSSLLGASSACLLNALKALAGIDKKLPLIAPGVIEPIQHLKVEHLGNHNPRLHTDELLIALSICAVTNPMAGYAIDQLGKLRGCEAHSTVILSRVDENLFSKIGVNITFEPKYQAKKLFHKN